MKAASLTNNNYDLLVDSASIKVPYNKNKSILVPRHIPGAVYAQSVEEQLQKLTLEVEKDLNKKSKNAEYFGNCAKCNISVYGPSTACQAMGKIYHNSCFTCCCCSRTLRGKAFYNVNGKIYCDEDYLYSGFQQSVNKCNVCGHPIMDMILQALGKCYHPGCFRCTMCNKSLDGVPFTVDMNNKIYCVEDYNKIQEALIPKCAKCHLPIVSENGNKETVKVVAMKKDFHVSCFVCESCGIKLTDKSQPRYFMHKTSVLCHRCHSAKLLYAQQSDFSNYNVMRSHSNGNHNFKQSTTTPRAHSWEVSGNVNHTQHAYRVKSWHQ